MTDCELEELFPNTLYAIADGSLRQKGAAGYMRLAAQRGGWDWESILKMSSYPG